MTDKKIDHEGRILAMLQAKDPTWTLARLRNPVSGKDRENVIIAQFVYGNSSRAHRTDEEWAELERQRDDYLAERPGWGVAPAMFGGKNVEPQTPEDR